MFRIHQIVVAIVLCTTACVDTPEPRQTAGEPARAAPFENIRVPGDLSILGRDAIDSSLDDTTPGSDLDAFADPAEFTLEVPLQLTRRPRRRVAILSNWDMANDDRGFELGVSGHQLPYVALSEAGDDSHVFFGERSVRLDRSSLLTVVYVRGQRLQIYLDGEPIADITDGLPPRMNASSAEASLGNRPAGDSGVTGLIGAPAYLDRALSDQEVRDRAQDIGAEAAAHPRLRRVTSGPDFHWFGYYDKLQFSPDNRYLLTARVAFQGRSPEPDDVIEVGVVDLEDGNAWRPLGQTRAWNWQQGTMLQWRPGSSHEVLFNDREDGAFVTRVVDARDGTLLRTLPHPIYHVTPDGRAAVGLDFGRIENLRRGYGYAGPVADDADLPIGGAPIYVMDLDSGTAQDVVSLEDVVAIDTPGSEWADEAIHYFNHLQWSPSADRFLFLHRWRRPQGGFGTRVFTARDDGSDTRLLTNEGGASHYVWRDDAHILIWMGEYRGYTLYDVDTPNAVDEVVLRASNGHQTYVPNTGRRWLITDTYRVSGHQTLFLYDVENDEIVVLARVPVPNLTGEFRVDFHPRVSADGRMVAIDSAAEDGRQQWVIPIGDITNPE